MSHEQDRGRKRASDEVHSANKWEKADLGDDDRNKKFLRLMGGAKKETKAKATTVSPSIDHSRSTEDIQRAEEELENQFNQGVEMRFNKKRHTGLGFSEEPPSPPPDYSEGQRSPRQQDDSAPEVQSANKWEEADLGDTDRNQKFMRLMGGGKKDHHGRKDHTSQHGRSDSDSRRTSRDLETQFHQGVSHQWRSQYHTGLRTPEDRYKTETPSHDKDSSSSSDSQSTGSKEGYKGLMFVKSSS